jgi:predicted transglutaminase-like protease
MSEDKGQHLEFIHNTINRLSDKSVQLKAITITLTAGLLAVYASTPKIFLIYITIPQIAFFWLLDSYYLQQERKFRGIYNDVSGVTAINTIICYEMPTQKYNKGKYNFFSCFFSISKLLFFGSMIIILMLTILALKCNYIS